jgi:hypothetical protein
MAVLAPPAPGFISVREAAELLHLSRNSVKRRIAAGLLRGYVDPSNSYQYVSKASVDEMLRVLQELQAAALLPGSEPVDERLTDAAEED